jgi:hypothetical protein
MAEEFVPNNSRDPAKEIFERLEAQVIDINRNMNLLMETVASKFRSFREV